MLAVLAGALAAIGAYYTHRSFGLNRQGQITERFTRAVDQLGNRDSTDVRLGGIYALERLARESRDDHGPIVEILTAYVREHTSILPEDFEQQLIEEDPVRYPEPPSADVQAALTVLGRRNTSYDPPLPWRLDLSGTYLPKAELAGTDLSRADLSYAVLDLARLDGAQLSHAVLRGARLAYTGLRGVNLEYANLDSVNACKAYLNDAEMAHAVGGKERFRGADLRGAQL